MAMKFMVSDHIELPPSEGAEFFRAMIYLTQVSVAEPVSMHKFLFCLVLLWL